MNLNKIIIVLLSFSLIGLGAKVIVVKKFIGRGGDFDFSSPFLFLPIGLFLIIIGGLLFFSIFRSET